MDTMGTGVFLLGGGNSNIFLSFSPPNFGEDGAHFDTHIFERGWNHQMVVYFLDLFNLRICPREIR